MYALIEFAGKQFKVEEGSSIKVPYVDGKVGSKVTFDKIIYMDDGKNKTVGTPIVAGVKIDGEIVSHGRERKVVVFKFKRRKGYQKKNTHRQEYSILKVGKVGKAKKVAKKESAKPVEVESKPSPKKEAVAMKKTAQKKTVAKKPVTKKAAPAKPKETKE
jgi:large subunit ribosomal protein L21